MPKITPAPDDLELLRAWRIGAVRAIRTPKTGTINRTLLVQAAGGDYVLRGYRHADRAPVEREHAVIAHVCTRGLPAVAPIALPGGATILERSERFYALFPRAPGRQLDRSQLALEHFAAMGGFLARVHAALQDIPPKFARTRGFTIDRAATLAGIERLEAAIRAGMALDEFDQLALAQLAGRRAWIAQSPDWQMPDVAVLEQQLIHGDYQESNLFFERGRVAAIIDWDQTYVAAREWEIARSLHYACTFDFARCRAFLAGYRAHAPVDSAALDLAATCYAHMRTHDLWQYQAIYLDGNQRVRRFVSPGAFIPLHEQWAALHEQLRTES
jgi:Ser/Thr protein kinase RdoA (MazF antagonist)